MKILQLSKKFPYPVKDGETLAITNLSRALVALGNEVSLLAMNTSKHHFKNGFVPDILQHHKKIDFIEVDNRIKAFDAFKNLFSSESYHISRFVSSDFERRLIDVLEKEEFDVVQLETLYLAPYIPVIKKYSKALIAMRAHNIEHEVWERVATTTGFLPKKKYIKYLTGKLKRYEVKQLNDIDLMVAISERDLGIFKQLGMTKPGTFIPIGIDATQYQPDYSSFQRPVSISFIGSLDWMPNQDGLRWFLDNVWPGVIKQYPDVKFHVAGRNMPDWVKHLGNSNLIIHGDVPDAKEFINAHSIMVVPLLSGSGMRAKILEGMALGKVIISTGLGVEGIDATDGQNIIVADAPGDFSKAIAACIHNPQSLEMIGRAGRALVTDHYDNNTIGKRLMDIYKKHLKTVTN